MPQNFNRISAEDLYVITKNIANKAVSDRKKRQELERQQAEERKKAALQQNQMPNYSGGSLWDQYTAAIDSGTAKNAGDFIAQRNARNAAWNRIGADTLDKDMEALAKSISTTYGTEFDPSKYYSQETLNGTAAQVKQIRDRLNALSEYYNTYGGTDEQKKAVEDQIKAYENLNSRIADSAKYYGQFKDADEYNAAMEVSKKRDYLTNEYDLEKGKADIDALKSNRDELSAAYKVINLTNYARTPEEELETGQTVVEVPKKKMTEALWKYAAESQKDKSNYVKIDLARFLSDYSNVRGSAYDSALSDYNLASALQSVKSMQSDKDADTKSLYSPYVTDENGTPITTTRNGKTVYTLKSSGNEEADRIYHTINDKSGMSALVQAGASSSDFSDWMDTYDAALAKSGITDEQKKTFNYLYNTLGGDTALNYYRQIEDEVKSRMAHEWAQNTGWLGTTANALLGSGVLGGIEKTGKGLHDLFTDSIEVNAPSSLDYMVSATAQKYNDMGGAKGYLGRLTTMSAQSIGNMVPSILMGNAIGGAAASLGAGTKAVQGAARAAKSGGMFLSSFRNGYEDARRSGNDEESSKLYGYTQGLLETFSEIFLGGIEGISVNALSKKLPVLQKAIEKISSRSLYVLANAGVDIVQEGIEEGFQEAIDPYIRRLILGEKNDGVNWADVADSALVGGLTAGVMNIRSLNAFKQNDPARENIMSAFYIFDGNGDIITDKNGNPVISTEGIDPDAFFDRATKFDEAFVVEINTAIEQNDTASAVESCEAAKAKYIGIERVISDIYGKSDEAAAIKQLCRKNVERFGQIEKLIRSGKYDVTSAKESLKKYSDVYNLMNENENTVMELISGEFTKTQSNKILRDSNLKRAFIRITGNPITGNTMSAKRNSVMQTLKAVSASRNTLKAAQSAIENGTTATEGHVNAAKIIDRAIQANRAENSRLRNSEKVKSAETKAAIDATNRQHRFLETVRNYVINGGDLSGFTESPVANVSGEGGTNSSSEVKTTQETVKNRVRADFSAYQDEITATEYNKVVKGSAAEQYTYFSNEEKKLNSDIKNIAESEAMTAEEKAEAIEKKNEEKNRLYALAKSTENVREMMRVKYAGNVDRLVEELQPKLKKYGIKIDVVDNIDTAGKSSSGAYFDRNTNTIKVSRNWDNFNNVVKLVLTGDGLAVTDRASVSFDRAVTQTIAHEIAHADSGLTLDFIKAVSGTQYDAFDLKGRLEHPDDRSWRSEDAQKEENWRRYVDAYTEQAMLEMKGTEEQRRASAEKVVNDAYIFEEIMADMFGAAVDDMGHSGTAGENIFWAMNRNKPGIIKRILNALERFIARIRGKDDFLAVEQRQAAERLRDMLTGELKRAYGTEVKGEAAVESGEGKRHSLAGANSRTADLNSLGGAYQMYQNGVSMDTIRKRTGWWLGKDGKWRYEISDKEMRFNPDGFVKNPTTVGDYVKHDQLFAAYPWVRDIGLRFVDEIDGRESLNGKYNRDNDTVYLKNGRTAEQMKSTLIHEIQHAIQVNEEFATGSSQKAAAAYLFNITYDKLKNNPKFAGIKSPKDKMHFLKQYVERTTGKTFSEQANYYYYVNYGEQESRAVQKRLAQNEDSDVARIENELFYNDGDIYDSAYEMKKSVDNLREMGYTEKQIDRIKKGGIQNDNLSGNVSESSSSPEFGRGYLHGEDKQSVGDGRTGRTELGVQRGGEIQGSQTGLSGSVLRIVNEVSKPEKRFSLSSNVEQTKDLIAVHNMTTAELEKSLDLGGLPMPSIAIIKAADGHSEYGDVSLVFGKDTIDPKKSARNKVYGGDAWTPTFPKIEYKANEKVGKRIRDKYYDLSRKYGYDNTRALYNYAQDLSDVLTSEGGEKAMIDKLYGDTGMMQIYLMDTGRERVANVNKETKTALTDGQVRQYENLIDTLGRDEMNGFAKKDGEELSDLVRRRKAFIAENEAGIRKAFEKTFIEDGMSAKDAAEVSAELALSDLRKYVLDTFNYIKNGAETVKTEFDSEATDAAIKRAADGEGYRKWVNDLFGGAEEKSGIRNSKDAYTASGNRRSFEALHWENNLENIVKAMLEQDETGGAFFSGTGIWGVSAKKYNSISEIKNDSSRLRTMNEAEYNALKEQYGARMQEIAQTLIDPKNDNYFIASDDAYSLIVDAVRNSKDESGILRYLKKYNSRATEKTASDIAALVRDIAEMPTGYFEAKPQRAVGFDEVKAVILPDNASGELVSRLESDGINTVTYKAGDENSRLEALNGVRDVRFSLTRANDEYMKAVESGNVEEQQRLVDEAAENAGYDSSILLHHGTSKFGFTKIDVAESDDGISFFATDKLDTAASYIPYYENSDAYDGIREIGKRTGKNRKVLTADSSIEDFLKYLKGVYPEEYRDARVITKEERYKFAEWDVSDAVKQAKRLLQYSIPKNVEDLVNMVIESEDNKSQWEGIARAYGSFKDIPEITYNGRYFNDASNIWYNLQDRIRLLNIHLTKDLAIVNELPKSKEELLYSYEQLTGGENVGIYGLYAKHEGQLVIRGGGSNWNNIPLGDITEKFNDWWVNEKGHEPADNGFYTRGNTRNIAEFAKFAGYRSVCFVDIYDIGTYGGGHGDLSDIYAFFYPESDVKSADPITYDDSGNVIPLTERFDSGNRDIRWSLTGTTDGRPVAVIDKDILDGVPESEWKSVARKAISEGFPDGIAVQGKNIRVNQTTRREYTKSDYTQWLFNHSKGVFADKMRAAAKLDDVVLAATNWTKDGGLKHPRKDNFVDFGRGNVLMSIGGNKYSAEVILAYPQVGAPVLYDVVTLNPDSFDLINEKTASANANAATSGAHTTRFSSDISAPNTVSLTQNTPDVNSQYMRDGEKDSSSERHSLVKSAQSELKALQKENEKLRQDVDDLKQELQLTHGRKLSRDALISSIQKILIDGYGVKLPAKELYPHVTNLYDMFYNNTVDGRRLKKDERVDTMRIIEEMDKIVDAVIENAVGVDDTYVEMKKLLPELRNTKLVVPMDARADAAQSAGFENWAEFRKANFGRVGFANEGISVDTYYTELSERYPELFPDGITHPGEQAAHIADVVNTIRESGINEYQLYDIEDERIRTSIKNDVMDIIGNAEKLQTFADRAAQKVEDTKLAEAMHHGADIAKLKRLNAEKVAGIKAENRKRLSDMRRKYQDRVESVRERYAEARANRSEKQKQTVLRNKVLRKYTEASSMLDRPTTENHFTEAMREPLMEFLAAVDITTGKSVAKQGVYDRILRVIEAANNMAAEDGKNGLNIAETDLNVQEKQLIVDSGLLERMSAWVEANKGKKLTELSSAQLEELNGIFNQLKHLTAEIKRLYDPREGLAAKSWQAQKEIGLAQTKEREQVLGAKTEKAREKYEQIHFGALDAAGYYNTLGSDTMTAQFERFRQCQNRFSENIQMFTDRLGEIVDGAIPKDEHGKNAKEVTLKLSHGTLTATPAQLMSVYLMLNQEDSRRCLFNEAGGVVIGKFTAERPKDGKLHIEKKRTFAQSGSLVLNEADAAKITAALTDGQRKRADAISALLNNEAARLGNEVSMAMYGYKKYTTENYFPMRTIKDYEAIATDPNHEMNLLGLSFTKERTGRAGKALVAEDIYDVIGRHLTNMAQYNAFAQELDNAKKMYSLRLGDGTSLKQRIIRSYGREADAFYNKLINNLSGVQMYTNNSAEALSDKLLSNYKAAAVAGNVSVVLKQPMSIFRALPEFSLAGLKKSMTLEDILNLSPKQLKANTAEMLKYSGIARLKAWGSSENMTRKSFESLYNDNSDTARQKINEFLTSGAENADMWTWAKLWRMSKSEIDAQGKYTAGSKEYFEAVDRKFSDVIGKTQVVQSALDSSMAVQNANAIQGMLYAFQNEPLKQFNYLSSVIRDARRGKPGAKAKLAKTIISSAANTVAVSAISTAMSLLRGTLDRDDDDELWDDILKSFGENVLADVLSGGLAPIWWLIEGLGSAIFSGRFGNVVERLDTAALTDLGDLINKYLVKQSQGGFNLGAVQDIVNVASNLFGWSAKNIFRDVKGAVDRIIFDFGWFSPMDKYNYLKAWKDVELTNKAAVTEAYYDVLRDAVDRGRYSDYVKIKRDMIYHGYTETKIKNAVMKSSLMDDLYELKKVNPGSYKAKVNSIVSSVSAVSSLEGKEFEDFIESAMKRREREDGDSKTDDEVYDEMHRKMEKEVKEQLSYIDVSKRAAYIKKMLKTYGEYGITEADILKVLRKAGKA